MEATQVGIAALIPLEDFSLLEEESLAQKLAALEKARSVSERIRAERGARSIRDVDSTEVLALLRKVVTKRLRWVKLLKGGQTIWKNAGSP